MVSPSASRNQWPKPRKRLKRTEDESMMIDAQSPISLESAQSITKSSPKTRATLHRIRFVDYQPPAVTSLALTPHTWKANLVFSYAHSQRQVLAVGKANGNIEIHVWIGDVTGSQKSNKQGWVLDRIIPALLPSGPAENLVFTHQTHLSESDLELLNDEERISALSKLQHEPPRLFSSTGSSTLFEWSYTGPSTGRNKASISSSGGAIWSLASNPSGTMLAAGCEDGSIRLISLWDGELEIVKKLDQVTTRLLSLAWGPQQAANKLKSQQNGKGKERAIDQSTIESPPTDVYLVAGCGDCAVRKWDVRSGRCISKMTTERTGKDPTLVWAVGVLHDHTIISGDSMGNVKFWDGYMGTQLQSLPAHKADILCLAIGPDGQTVFTSGVDQTTVQFTYLTGDPTAFESAVSSAAQWIISGRRRLHSHDVRALVVSPSFTLSAPKTSSRSLSVPIVVSGGIDMSLTLCPGLSSPASPSQSPSNIPANPVSDSASLMFDKAMQRKCTYVPQRSPVLQISSESNLVLCRRDTGVSIWRIKSTLPDLASNPPSSTSTANWELCTEMALKTRTNLISSAISPDGQWLAVSDLYEVRLFRLEVANNGQLLPKRQKTFTTLLSKSSQLKPIQGASYFLFSTDSSRLALATILTSLVVLIDLEPLKIFSVFKQHAQTPQHSPNRYGRLTLSSTSSNHVTPRTNGITNSSIHVNGHSKTNGKSPLTNGNLAIESDGDDDSEDVLENGLPSNAEEPEVISNGLSSPSAEIAQSQVVLIALSDDGQWVASVDSSRRLLIFDLDTCRLHCTLPSPELLPTCMIFCPNLSSLLLVGLPNNTVESFDVEERKFATWARPYFQSISSKLTHFREPLIGVAVSPSSDQNETGQSFVFWGATWTASFNLPAKTSLEESESLSSKRVLELSTEEEIPRSRSESTEFESSLNVSHRYQPLLGLDFLRSGELVAVERPYFALVENLPQAFVVPGGKYGS